MVFKFFPRNAFRVSLSVCVLLVALRAEATTNLADQMQLGNPSGAIMDTNNHSHYLFQLPVYAEDYSDTNAQPNWVSWDLSSEDANNAVSRVDHFYTNIYLPPNFFWLPGDPVNPFTGSGYDRGHMCPSADRTDSRTNNDMLFLMSNMIPQKSEQNQGIWAQFEDQCRTIADAGNEVLITCGPSLFTASKLYNNRVPIPGYTWKIVVVVRTNNNGSTAASRITPTNRVIVVRIPNTAAAGSDPWQNYVTNAIAVEADTGFTFFNALFSNLASVLRNKIDGQTPPPPALSGFSPASGPTNSTVVISGTNFVFATNVTFHGVSTAFTIDSTTQITAMVPPGATSGSVSVETLGGTATSSSNFTVTVATGVADLAILKSHTGSFTQGDVGGTYTIIVTNVGTEAAFGSVTVTDALPTGLTVTAISGSGWTTNIANLTATRSDILGAGAAYPPLTFTVNVSASAPASITNIASVSAGGGETNLANNTAADPTTILPLPTADLAISKTHAGNFTQGGASDTYTILVTNVGAASSSGSITVTDSLPTGLTITAMSGLGWTTNLANATATRSDALAAGIGYPPLTVTVSVATNAPASVTNIASVTGGGDTNLANNTASDPTTINPASSGGNLATNVVISQVYGGGGNSGAAYQNDFVELFNPLTVAVNVSTWSVQYASATGNSWVNNKVNLTGSIQPRHYYLIELASNAAIGAPLPTADCTNTSINMSATAGKVALVNNQIALTGTNPSGSNVVVDFVGYGNTANGFEGLAPAPGPTSNLNSASRKNGGYTDSNDNSADFLVLASSPRNSASPTNPPPEADLAISLSHAGSFAQGDAGDTYTIVVTNLGTAGSSGSVTVTDSVPTGITITAINGSGWTANPGNSTATRSDSLGAGGSYPALTITVHVATNAPANVTNVVAVSGGGESNTANDNASDETTITALTPIQLWRYYWFGTTANSGPAADTAVASSDGMPNLLKYGLGLDPVVPTNNPMIGEIATGFLRLTSPKNPDATDVTFQAEITPKLSPPAWTTNGTTVDQNTTTLFQAHANAPVNSNTNAFIRLHISRP